MKGKLNKLKNIFLQQNFIFVLLNSLHLFFKNLKILIFEKLPKPDLYIHKKSFSPYAASTLLMFHVYQQGPPLKLYLIESASRHFRTMVLKT